MPKRQKSSGSAAATSLSRPVALRVSHRYVDAQIHRYYLPAKLVRDYFQIRHSFLSELFLLAILFLNNLPVRHSWRGFPSHSLSSFGKVIFDVFTEFFLCVTAPFGQFLCNLLPITCRPYRYNCIFGPLIDRWLKLNCATLSLFLLYRRTLIKMSKIALKALSWRIYVQFGLIRICVANACCGIFKANFRRP